MSKVLFIASVTRHINAFHLPYLELFKKSGYDVEVAANGELDLPFCDKRRQVDFERSPLNKKNLLAHQQLKKIIDDGKYDIIHCHTPVAAMLTRLVARRARKAGTRVIYTAHGFHFFKGAPLKNWLIYFPVEWFCSFLTDTLITINTEDFAFAKKHLHAKRTEYVHGVGIDVAKFRSVEVDREKKREELGIPIDSFAVLSVGELNGNKNHETVLRAIAALERKDITYIICGIGNKKDYLEKLAEELGIKEQLILAGFRTDLAEIYKCCDVFAFPSKREGLPVSVMEAMASGLPCVASDIRGNRDLIENGTGGLLCDNCDADAFGRNIKHLANERELRQKMGEYNSGKVENFGIKNVVAEMNVIYEMYRKEG